MTEDENDKKICSKSFKIILYKKHENRTIPVYSCIYKKSVSPYLCVPQPESVFCSIDLVTTTIVRGRPSSSYRRSGYIYRISGQSKKRFSILTFA